MELLPRVGRSLAFARDDGEIVVLSEAKDLLDGVTAKSREVPRFARDDGEIVVLSEAKDLLDGVTAKSREVLRFCSVRQFVVASISYLRDKMLRNNFLQLFIDTFNSRLQLFNLISTC
ncbi:Uncharacterised protein [Legionella maceachernii]|nr:Uncharacterised protein [Legionella maceachernii]